MRVKREVLLQALQVTAPGLSTRDIVEQATHYVFKSGRVYTCNDEVFCHATSGLGEGLEGAVVSTPLVDLLSKLPDEELEVSATDSHLLVTGKGGRRSGVVMQREVLLPIDDMGEPEEWKPLHKDFAEAVGVVYKCASKDENEFANTCVHLHPKWVEASDDLQLCRWKMKTGFARPYLVRQSSIKHVVTLGVHEFGETDDRLHFRNRDGVVFSVRRFTDEFPDMSDILTTEGEPATLPKGLIAATDTASIFGSDDRDNVEVKVELTPGRIRVRSQGVYGWYTEPKKLPEYKGPPMSFLISPQLLVGLVENHNDCIISESVLRVDTGNYQYATCLGEVPADDRLAPEEEEGAPKKKKKVKR